MQFYVYMININSNREFVTEYELNQASFSIQTVEYTYLFC